MDQGFLQESLNTSRYVRFGPFHIDQQRQQVYRNGSRLRLQGKVFQVLMVLLQKQGEVVTREELKQALWPADTHVNYDANVNTTVNKLRQALGESTDKPLYIETIPRKGYSFIAKIEYADRPPASEVPPTKESLPVTASAEHAAGKPSFFRTALLSRWFAAGVVTLVIVSMLFGAALVLYAHR